MTTNNTENYKIQKKEAKPYQKMEKHFQTTSQKQKNTVKQKNQKQSYKTKSERINSSNS